MRVWIGAANSAKGPWTVQEILTGGEAWRGTPFVLDRRIINISNEQQLIGINLTNSQFKSSSNETDRSGAERDPQSQVIEFLRSTHKPDATLNFDKFSNEILLRRPRVNSDIAKMDKDKNAAVWGYRNFAIGNAPPVAWAQNKRLIVLSDGSLLMSFDPQSGKRRWALGLADYPLASPSRQVCSLNDSVFAASRGKLRCIDIQNGKIHYERYLGDTVTQWQTSIVWNDRSKSSTNSEVISDENHVSLQAIIAVWPVDVFRSQSSCLLLCDAENGEILQRLRADSEIRKLVFDRGGNGIVWTEKSLSGLRPITK